MNFQESYWAYLMFALSLFGAISNFTVGKIIIWTKLVTTKACYDNNKISPVTGDAAMTTSREKGHPRHYFILTCLFVSDFMFCFSNSIAFLITGILGHSPQFVCQYQGVTTVTFASAGVMMLALLAYDRYLTIVIQKNLTRIKALWLIVISFSYSWLLGLVLLIQPPLKLAASPSRVFCTPPWHDLSPAVLTQSLSCIVTLVITITLTSIFYLRIYRSVTLASRNARINTVSFTAQNSKNKQKQQHRDNNIAFRMAVLVLVFAIGWGCYCTMIIVSLITSKPVSPLYDLISIFLALSESAFNPVIYYLMKNKLNPVAIVINNTNNTNADNKTSPLVSPKHGLRNPQSADMKREHCGQLQILPPSLDGLSTPNHINGTDASSSFKERDNGGDNLKLPTNNFLKFDTLVSPSFRSFSGTTTSNGNVPDATISPPISPPVSPLYPAAQTVRLLPLSFSSFHHSQSQSKDVSPGSIRTSPAKLTLPPIISTMKFAVDNPPAILSMPLRQIVVRS